MNLDSDIVAGYKNKFCVINFVLCCCLIVFGDENISSNIKALLGLLIMTLGPFFWNSWLYENMFETQKSRQIISYKAFLIIGLIMVLGVFSGIMAVLIEDLFTLEKTLNVRWLLMASFFFGAFTFVRLRAK